MSVCNIMGGRGEKRLEGATNISNNFFLFYIRRAWRDGVISLGVFNAPSFSPGFCGSS